MPKCSHPSTLHTKDMPGPEVQKGWRSCSKVRCSVVLGDLLDFVPNFSSKTWLMCKHCGQPHEPCAEFKADLASWQGDFAPASDINSRLRAERVSILWYGDSCVLDDFCIRLRLLSTCRRVLTSQHACRKRLANLPQIRTELTYKNCR